MSTSNPTFADLNPRQDATARLLLLCAKSELTEEQKRDARTLAAQVLDWDEFVVIAALKFAVTYAQRHLQACAADIVPAREMERMRKHANATALSALRILGAQLGFHKACIETTGATHAYLKGAALALQYSSSIGDRYCRDVDVLVASKDFPAVLKAALASGYRIVLNHEPVEFTDQPQDLSFLARHADVVTLLGPSSVPIEVHRWLDKLSVNFDLDFALSTAEDVRLSGVTVKTFSKQLHFVYFCYHHSRHFWSHLHWLADLDGMSKMLSGGREQVFALADAIGIRPTLEAAFEFHDLVSRPGLWGEAIPVQTGGGQFLKACLVNLTGDLSLEEELRKGMALNDFMSPWQVSPGRYNEFWLNSWIRRLRPGTSQYIARRLPRHFEWLYSVQNGLELAKNGLALAVSRGASKQAPRGSHS